MDEVRKIALDVKPKVIVAGLVGVLRVTSTSLRSARSPMRSARTCGSIWRTSPGLVAAGLHPSPVPYADVVSSTVHKTLGGPRSGLILAKQEWAKKLNSAVFPGQQGGPLMHAIAAKAAAFKIAGTEEFKDRQERTLAGAHILAERLTGADVVASVASRS